MKKFRIPEYLKFWKSSISLHWYSAICSLITFLFNIPFLQFAYEHANMGGWGCFQIMATLVLLLLLLNFSVYYLLVFLLRYVGRVIVALWIFLSALCTYFIFTYHVMMDETMLGNVFNTRYSEASGFFSFSLVLSVILFGILPAAWLLGPKIKRGSWKQFGKFVGGGFLISILLVVLSFKQVLWISKYDTELGGLVMPWSYTVNTCRYISHKLAKEEKEIMLPDAHFKDDEKCVMVLVIGESARKANFQLYGYKRPTNPRLSALDDLHVYNAQSCATYTTAGTKSILEYEETDDLYEILPNYLFRAGADVVWRTSNWGEPPVHIDEYKTSEEVAAQYGWEGDIHDEVLTLGLKERIIQSDKNKVLIILHTSTSHGPDYQRQYPADFERFTPVCAGVEEAQDDQTKLVNAYDNTILYTDHFLCDVIDSLRTMTDWHAAMLYVSDHGESLGEDGLFMHGVPMNLAPRVQYEIPMLLWTNDVSRQVKKVSETVDQHVVFHTVLDWMSVDSEIFKKDQSLFAAP